MLAMGNFLNDGTERCGADGFSFETLSLLDSVKDPEGKDLRHTLFQVMFLQREEESSKLVSELKPVLQNVQRNLSKGDDGSEKLQKKVNVTFEDFDTCVGQLADEFTQRQDTMAMLMQYIDDPADQFKLHMPAKFASAKEEIDALVTKRDNIKEKYKGLLKWFKINNMKSDQFCLIWDNLFVPESLVVTKPEKIKKEVLVPAFCQGRPVALEGLQIRGLSRYRRKEAESQAKGKERKDSQRSARIGPPNSSHLYFRIVFVSLSLSLSRAVFSSCN